MCSATSCNCADPSSAAASRSAEPARSSLRGQAVRSCVMPVSAVKEQEITTLEGLGTPEKPHAIQQAFIDEGAAQCGFCLSGVILTAKALMDEHPKASDEQMREAMSNVLCRCFTHARMMRAIQRYQNGRI